MSPVSSESALSPKALEVLAMIAESAGVPIDEVESVTWTTDIDGLNVIRIIRSPVEIPASAAHILAIREAYREPGSTGA